MPRKSRRSLESRTAPDALGAVRSAALDRLARREHGSRELAAKLLRKGFEGEIVDAALADLAAEGLLSDARYAAGYVRSRVARGHGPRKIEAELRRLGIDDELIGRAVAEEATDWNGLACRERAKRFGPAPPADWPARARQARFLEQRGFSRDQVRAALDDAGPPPAGPMNTFTEP
jgi:regulatory protein